MAFLRDREGAAQAWRRFRQHGDLFTCVRDGSTWVARVDATAERTMELFHELTVELGGAVQLSIVRRRDDACWQGSELALTDVREAVARLRVPLAAAGGVEVSVYTDEDQLSVSAQLSLHLFCRSDRWRTLLATRGLQERRAIPDRRWARSRDDFAVSPALDGVIDSIASALSLSGERPLMPVLAPSRAPGAGTPPTLSAGARP